MSRFTPGRLLRSQPFRALAAGAILSIVAAAALQQYYELLAARRLNEKALDLEARLVARIEAYMAVLRGGVGLIAAMPDLSRDDFRRYVAQVGVEQNYPGIQGIGVSFRIPPDAVDQFEARARVQGSPGFRVWPDRPRDEYHSILYLEPQDARNQAAIGFDMSTEPVRRAAMQQARRTGRPAATGRVTLVQEIEAVKQSGFLIYVPFYEGTVWPRNDVDRIARLRGFVYAPFRTGDLLQAISGDVLLDDVRVEIYDSADRIESSRLHTVGLRRLAERDLPIQQVRTFQVINQTWTLVYSTTADGFVPPWLLLLLGLASSGGVAMLMGRESKERRRAERSEAETREREGELALLIDVVPAAVTFVDRDGVFRISNHRYEEWLGLDPRSMLGRPMRDVLGPAGYAAVEPQVEKALRGESVTFERWHHLGRSGARYLSTFFVPHRSRAGELNGFYALTSDLTSLKRAEEGARFVADCGKLLISSLDYEAAARGVVHLAVPRVADIAVLLRVQAGALVPVAVAHADDGTERMLTNYLKEIRVSLSASHNIATAARSGMVVVAPEVTQADLDRISSVREHQDFLRRLQLRSAIHIPVVVRGRIWAVFSFGASELSGRRFSDQHRHLADEISTRVRLAVENAILHQEAKQEIEERRRAEQTAREAEERFRLLVEGARDYAIILLDPDGAVASWNQGAERILGFSENEALRLPISRLYTADDRRDGAPEAELARARETGSALEERWYVRKEGSRFWASGHTLALRTETGLLRGYAKIMRDLTGWKQSEEELEHRVQQRTLELNEAVQELEAFSYSVSHDLRAPLRSIRGFTDLTLEEAGDRLTGEERGYLGRVQRAVARLDQLISDLLAYTRVSKTRVELSPVNLHALITDIQREHPEFQLPHADIALEGTLDPVIGNVAYLTQCVTNLLGNAVKFVRPGQMPQVRLRTSSAGGRVRLYVRDNGIGIAQENLGRVFEMFERLHVGGSYEGTGVGLAIVRRAVQRMNGSISVESTEGEGTTFIIELAAVDPSGEIPPR